jgi:hypothetical protein
MHCKNDQPRKRLSRYASTGLSDPKDSPFSTASLPFAAFQVGSIYHLSRYRFLFVQGSFLLSNTDSVVSQVPTIYTLPLRLCSESRWSPYSFENDGMTPPTARRRLRAYTAKPMQHPVTPTLRYHPGCISTREVSHPWIVVLLGGQGYCGRSAEARLKLNFATAA